METGPAVTDSGLGCDRRATQMFVLVARWGFSRHGEIYRDGGGSMLSGEGSAPSGVAVTICVGLP